MSYEADYLKARTTYWEKIKGLQPTQDLDKLLNHGNAQTLIKALDMVGSGSTF